VLSNPLLPTEMFEHYRQVQESKRLLDGIGELERDRTQDILKRHLTQRPQRSSTSAALLASMLSGLLDAVTQSIFLIQCDIMSNKR